jgi:IS66 Orf2 like protein
LGHPSSYCRRAGVGNDEMQLESRRGCRDTRDGIAGAEGRRVIGPSGAVRVMVATRPVDFRKGAEGLSALVREIMAADPFSGTV